MTFDIFLDCLIDALIDTAKLLPFLFIAFLLIEGTEHKTKAWMEKLASGSRKTGPLWGALLGLIPQCGFSVMSANMYAGGLITSGTLMAVFLATSDEAIIVMLGNSSSIPKILPLLACKFLLGVAAGFIIDMVIKHDPHHSHHHEPHDLCENCGCDKYPGIVRPALYHTGKLALFILVFNLIINMFVSRIGQENLSVIMMSGSMLQPLLTAAIGLVPNCVASILITQLYLAGTITFGSAVAGLAAGAGVGLAVLFKMHKCLKKNIAITATLYVIAVLGGIVINYAQSLLK